MSNTLCCVSKVEPYSYRFLKHMSDWCVSRGWQFLLAVDGDSYSIERAFDFTSYVFPVHSDGYIESVLDKVIDRCEGEYIFRLDDDESISNGLSDWFDYYDWNRHEIYTFPRYNLWLDEQHYIPGLYPDNQIRFATKAKSYGRNKIHNLSPHGFGYSVTEAPILHHKFLIKDYDERKRIAEIYEKIQVGAGLGNYLKYNLPEDYYSKKGISIFHEQITN